MGKENHVEKHVQGPKKTGMIRAVGQGGGEGGGGEGGGGDLEGGGGGCLYGCSELKAGDNINNNFNYVVGPSFGSSGGEVFVECTITLFPVVQPIFSSKPWSKVER